MQHSNWLILGVFSHTAHPSAGVRLNGNQAHGAPRHSEITDVISLTSAGTAKVAYLQTCMCKDSVKNTTFLKKWLEAQESGASWKVTLVSSQNWSKGLVSEFTVSRPFSVTWLSVRVSWVGAAKLTVTTKPIHLNTTKSRVVTAACRRNFVHKTTPFIMHLPLRLLMQHSGFFFHYTG